MESAGEIRRITRNESQGALTIESLETVEQLSSYFQVRFHSQTHQHEFVHLFWGANGEGFRPDAGERKNGLARRRICRSVLSFPHWQPANRTLLESLISCDCTDDLGKATAALDEIEFSSLSHLVCSQRAGDPRRIARWI